LTQGLLSVKFKHIEPLRAFLKTRVKNIFDEAWKRGEILFDYQRLLNETKVSFRTAFAQ